MKRLFPAFLICLSLLCFVCSADAETFTCLACHSAMNGKIRTETGALINVNIDSEKYAASVHGGFDCLMCHKQFSSNPHEQVNGSSIPKNVAAIASSISHKAKADPVARAACIECHDSSYTAWQESLHGKNVIEKKLPDGAFCNDCHGSPHYILPKSSETSPVIKKNVVKTCGECHENETLAKKYGWGTHLLDRYRESFHGKKYIIGHPNAPTCVSCHGSHNVRKWEDPKSPVAWENRTATCGKCHEGATKKFVAAITHKPTGKDNPVPYWFEKGLIVLLLGVFAFILGHVILEALSEIRHRVLKKAKEEGHNE